jgi:hypothetical protein
MMTRIRGAYLRDEKKYDRWGSLGKVLVTLEVFRAEGVAVDPRVLERYVNAVFPRTFSCQRTPVVPDALPSRASLRDERASVAGLFRAWGVPEDQVDTLALEEVGERNCLDAAFLREYLMHTGE